MPSCGEGLRRMPWCLCVYERECICECVRVHVSVHVHVCVCVHSPHPSVCVVGCCADSYHYYCNICIIFIIDNYDGRGTIILDVVVSSAGRIQKCAGVFQVQITRHFGADCRH